MNITTKAGLVILSPSLRSRVNSAKDLAAPSSQILRCAQDDKLLLILLGKNHYRPMARQCAQEADKSAVRQ